MPIYEYVCTACDHRADILQGINDPAPNFCPSCGAEGTMRKQFAPPTIHYKGSGWAKKDRGSSPATRASRSSAGDGAKDAGSSGEGPGSGSGSGSGGSGSGSGSGGSGSGGSGSGGSSSDGSGSGSSGPGSSSGSSGPSGSGD